MDLNNLFSKFKKLDSNATFKEDISGLIVDANLLVEEFMDFQEISKITILFKNDWKAFSFKDLKEDCLSLCQKFNVKSYRVENKFHNKTKISAKSLYRHINPYLKHEGLGFDENGDIIYLEIKKFDKDLKYRLSYSNNNLWDLVGNPLNVDLSKFAVVIENPTLVLEVSDFLRLCWIFKLPLYVVTNNKPNFEKILKKAKEETKGIDYEKMTLKIFEKLPSEYSLIGFSKHALNNEKDLNKVLKQLDLGKNKIAFVFGDDKFGLSQETRDKLNYCFRLTPELKKPLRGSHALSYVLGLYVNSKL